MKGISIRAVLLATLAVMGVDILSGITLAYMFDAPSVDASMSEEQLRAATEQLIATPGYLRSALILGTASTILGGYLAARMARMLPYFNALAFGLVSILLGWLTTGELPTWFRAVGLGLTLPAALVGAHVAKRLAARA